MTFEEEVILQGTLVPPPLSSTPPTRCALIFRGDALEHAAVTDSWEYVPLAITNVCPQSDAEKLVRVVVAAPVGDGVGVLVGVFVGVLVGVTVEVFVGVAVGVLVGVGVLVSVGVGVGVSVGGMVTMRLHSILVELVEQSQAPTA